MFKKTPIYNTGELAGLIVLRFALTGFLYLIAEEVFVKSKPFCILKRAALLTQPARVYSNSRFTPSAVRGLP